MTQLDANLRRALAGISGILVTPFDGNDQLALPKLRPIVERAIAAGVHCLVSNGNTSEFYAMTDSEAEAAVAFAADCVGGRVPLIGGVGRSVHEACRLAQASRRAGVTALMVHQPPDPFAAPRGVCAYLQRIAEAADGLPLMLYLRNDGIGLESIESLCRIPGVAGVKWAAPSPIRLAEAIRRCDPQIVWVGGLAEPWAPPFYAVGARGFTSGLINVWPQRSVEIHTALEAGDYQGAMALIADIAGFEEIRAEEQGGTNVAGVKAALRMLGLDCGAARPPAGWPLTDLQQRSLSKIVSKWGMAIAT